MSDDYFSIQTNGHRNVGSGQCVMHRETSILCYRGSHEYSTAKNKCHGIIKSKKRNCECECHTKQ